MKGLFGKGLKKMGDVNLLHVLYIVVIKCTKARSSQESQRLNHALNL